MCLYPRKVMVQSRTFGVRRVIDAPCGKCVECLKQRQNDWKLRICHECSYWSHVYFFTLTYRNSALPCSVTYEDEYDNIYGIYRMPEAQRVAADLGMVVKSTAFVDDVQNFIKRMRTDYERKQGKKLDMKYFICAEYGPNPNGTKRPHYHGVLMTSALYYELLPYFNQWKSDYGRMEFVEVGATREDKSSVSNYVSKYCAKGCFESRAEDIANKHVSRAFSVMSKNIGARWLSERSDDYLSRVPSLITVDGDWSIEDIDKFYHATLECGYYNLAKMVGSKYEHPIWKEVDDLIENMRVWDGDKYSYRLPRYYRDRLFSVKKTFLNYDTKRTSPSLRIASDVVLRDFYSCSSFDRLPEKKAQYSEAPFLSTGFITYSLHERKDTRYVRENFLSCAIAYRLQLLALARSREDERKYKGSLFYRDKNGCIHSRYEDDKRAAIEARRKVAESSLRNFYQSNMWKNRVLDFDADTFSAEDFTLFSNY